MLLPKKCPALQEKLRSSSWPIHLPKGTLSVLSPVSGWWPGASPGRAAASSTSCSWKPGGQALPPASPPVRTLKNVNFLAFVCGSRSVTFGAGPSVHSHHCPCGTGLDHQSSRKPCENPKGTASPGRDPMNTDPEPPTSGRPGLPHPRLEIRAPGTGDMHPDPAPPLTSRETLGELVRLLVPQFPGLSERVMMPASRGDCENRTKQCP